MLCVGSPSNSIALTTRSACKHALGQIQVLRYRTVFLCDFYQLGTHSAPGWSYSYFAVLHLFVCLSICHSLGKPGNKSLAACRYAWLFQVSWFVRLHAEKGRKAMPILSTVEAQLSLHQHDPVDSQSQLESISSPVGRPTTCTCVVTL